jgi:uncharacterized protein (DUF1697 family)
MNRYVAFLRGMNLGDRRIKNDELRAEFEVLGFSDVACFRASGNVIFGSEEGDGAKLTGQIEAGLGEALGYAVPVFLRSAAELRAVAAREAFDAPLVAASKGKLQVAFLGIAPSRKKSEEALALSSYEDRLAIAGRELHWLPSCGISESELDLKGLESILGLWTMRTKGTIDQIAARHFF